MRHPPVESGKLDNPVEGPKFHTKPRSKTDWEKTCMDDNLAILKEFLSTHVKIQPEETLTPETRLDSIGLDSLGLLELVFEIEDKHGIHLPEDVPLPETVGQLMTLIEKYKPAATNE